MKFLFILLFIPFIATAQQITLQPLNDSTNTSIRGLSVVDDQIAWVSGSNGQVGKTINGGKDWVWTKPLGFETLDFRDIKAFDDQKAVIVNAGSPAFILLTVDGGKSWQQTYVNRDSAVFLDGMDFWDNNQGIIFGDPIKGKLHLLRTRNGGFNWEDISKNLKHEMKLGEAGFAASGTTIKTLGKGKVWVATGGAEANIYYSKNYGNKWQKFANPILQGANSTGPFSIDFFDAHNGIVVGGDYLKDKESLNNALYTTNGGKKWNKPKVSVSGYRSAVLYVDEKLCLAAGSSGLDSSTDGGRNWKHISDVNLNAVQKAKSGKLILAAGNKGQIYRLDIKPD
jgi:photosystem II stability/assembly factor-like uncharacterized protein